MVVIIIVAVLFLVMGIVILIGMGDNLIAGYNTASKEEKSNYNVKRLRALVGGLLIILAPAAFLLELESIAASLAFSGITLVACIVAVILANTWAKEKSE